MEEEEYDAYTKTLTSASKNLKKKAAEYEAFETVTVDNLNEMQDVVEEVDDTLSHLESLAAKTDGADTFINKKKESIKSFTKNLESAKDSLKRVQPSITDPDLAKGFKALGLKIANLIERVKVFIANAKARRKGEGDKTPISQFFIAGRGKSAKTWISPLPHKIREETNQIKAYIKTLKKGGAIEDLEAIQKAIKLDVKNINAQFLHRGKAGYKRYFPLEVKNKNTLAGFGGIKKEEGLGDTIEKNYKEAIREFVEVAKEFDQAIKAWKEEVKASKEEANEFKSPVYFYFKEGKESGLADVIDDEIRQIDQFIEHINAGKLEPENQAIIQKAIQKDVGRVNKEVLIDKKMNVHFEDTRKGEGKVADLSAAFSRFSRAVEDYQAEHREGSKPQK